LSYNYYFIKYFKLVYRKNEELYNLGEEEKVYTILVGKSEGKRPLGSPIRRWEDGIRMDLREIGLGVEWIELAQDRDRWRAVVNFGDEPSGSGATELVC
jgi:hypothetical protein